MTRKKVIAAISTGIFTLILRVFSPKYFFWHKTVTHTKSLQCPLAYFQIVFWHFLSESSLGFLKPVVLLKTVTLHSFSWLYWLLDKTGQRRFSSPSQICSLTDSIQGGSFYLVEVFSDHCCPCSLFLSEFLKFFQCPWI